MPKPHILLIHGGYHRAWHFQFLKAELEKEGYKATTIDLPAGGDSVPETGALAADTAAIQALLEQAASESDSIIPVFHSYGGIPGSDAAAQISPDVAKKIPRMIYLAALVVREGEALSTPFDGKLAPWTTPSADGKTSIIDDPISTFYSDLDPDLAAEAARHLVPYATSVFHESAQHCGWKLFPTTYVFCSEDRILPMAVAQSFFDAMSKEDRSSWEFETLEAGHSPYLAMPQECARLIRRIAGENVGS